MSPEEFDRDRWLSDLREQTNLTPAEARAWVAFRQRGDDIEAAAEEIDRSVGTVKVHLKEIYRKAQRSYRTYTFLFGPMYVLAVLDDYPEIQQRYDDGSPYWLTPPGVGTESDRQNIQ